MDKTVSYSESTTEEFSIIRQRLENDTRRHDIERKNAVYHIGHKKWDIISKSKVPETDVELWLSLLQFEHSSNDTHVNAFNYVGEDIYRSVRSELVSHGLVLTETTQVSRVVKSSKKKPANKAEEIKKANHEKKIRDELKEIFRTQKSLVDVRQDSSSLRSKFVELTLVRMMLLCKKLLAKHLQFKTDINNQLNSSHVHPEVKEQLKSQLRQHNHSIAELIIGYNKIVLDKKKNKAVSPTCIADLEKCIEAAKKTINFQSSEVIIHRPDLIFRTSYDHMLSSKKFSLHQSQADIFDFVTKTDSYLALVHTMLGSGKTSMVLPICGWIAQQRKLNSSFKTKLVFCCPNEIVLLEVAQMAYRMAIPFGIVVYDHDTQFVSYKWSTFVSVNTPQTKKKNDGEKLCLEKEMATLYICDCYSARILLEERAICAKNRELYIKESRRDPINNPLISQRIPVVPDYIFMGDELTKDADTRKGYDVDSGFSLTTEMFILMMKLIPPKTVLMSATLPTIDQIPEFYDSIRKTYPDMVVRSFSSSEAKVGCALISQSGELFMPHSGSKTVAEIEKIVEIIRTNPFVGRFYTFEVLIRMVITFENCALATPNLNSMFDDPNQANQSNIQRTAYQMLTSLIETNSDELVEKVCTSSGDKQLYSIEHRGIELSKLLTTEMARMPHGCLVFSTDPVASALYLYEQNFSFYKKDVTEKNVFDRINIGAILDKYQKSVKQYTLAKERTKNKSDSGFGKQNRENDTKEKFKASKDAPQADDKPDWTFPPQLQLCSEEHLRMLGIHDPSLRSNTVLPEDIGAEELDISPDIMTLLASGIGIYSTDHPSLNDTYLKLVLSLAKQRLIKVLFADSSIAYGTNLAVSDIVMIDEPMTLYGSEVESITERHSMKTIFQMLGRAGRGGNLSYEARVYTTSLENNLIRKIHEYIRGTLDEGERDEIANIMRAFRVLW